MEERINETFPSDTLNGRKEVTFHGILPLSFSHGRTKIGGYRGLT
jgi:hypothetical protein